MNDTGAAHPRPSPQLNQQHDPHLFILENPSCSQPPSCHNECCCQCQTSCYATPHILRLRPLPWSPPLLILLWFICNCYNATSWLEMHMHSITIPCTFIPLTSRTHITFLTLRNFWFDFVRVLSCTRMRMEMCSGLHTFPSRRGGIRAFCCLRANRLVIYFIVSHMYLHHQTTTIYTF
jgi:hypothetical protein